MVSLESLGRLRHLSKGGQNARRVADAADEVVDDQVLVRRVDLVPGIAYARNGSSGSVRAGGSLPRSSICTSANPWASRWDRSWCRTSSGVMSGISRKSTLAEARAGRTVLHPGPSETE